jgi:hypothetical protein
VKIKEQAKNLSAARCGPKGTAAISQPRSKQPVASAYKLLTGKREIRGAFQIWRDALERHGSWRGNLWWLSEERIVFANREHRSERKLGKFVVLGTDATGANVTVQLNEPAQRGNENPLSGVARDDKGRLHLVRQGVLHKNTQSTRIFEKQFIARTGLAPIDLTIAGVPAKRAWFLVTGLDASSSEICRNIASFVDACNVARGDERATTAKADAERLEELFGRPEAGGQTSVVPSLGPKKRNRLQGTVWQTLQALLIADGRDLLKPRHPRGYEVDGELSAGNEKILIEIKCTTSASDIYEGLGQLTLYPRLLPRLSGHARILLIPGLPRAALAASVEECGIELHSYDLLIDGSDVTARFSPSFLDRCGLAAIGNPTSSLPRVARQS